MQTTAELVAGRELDTLIAEKVMDMESAGDDPMLQWGINGPMWKARSGYHWDRLPAFSTDIAAAWQVVEKLGGHLDIIHWADSDTWQVNFGSRDGRRPYTMPQDDWGETAPLAICRAALAAVSR
jgi:hypothetical protein